MTSRLPFVKASACGNDFLLIDGRLVRSSHLKNITMRICDRHRGVGADGVEWLFPSDRADVYAKLINSDGSDAEVSGNGTRCVAAWWMEKERRQEYYSSADSEEFLESAVREPHVPALIRVLTDAGVKECTLVQREDMKFVFRSDMGEAAIAGELTVDLNSGSQSGIQLSVGNPQFIVFVNEFGPDWQAVGAEMERHKAFPQRTNVEFVKVTGPQEIAIRIFERGAGETQSSGTGSCASAIAAIYTGRVKSPVKVVSPGGPQTVSWDGVRILLEGPAQILCEGEFFL